MTPVHTHSKELAETRVVGLARLALCIFEILGQPEADHLEHAVKGLIGSADGDKGIGGVEIGPVFQVRGGLEQLRRERESDCCEVRDADESIATGGGQRSSTSYKP